MQKGIDMEWLYAKAIPIEAQYLYRKARELSEQGQTEMALNYYKQALVIAPNYSQVYYEMGDCLAKLGLYAEAIEKYRRAVHIDPATPEPHKKMDRLLSLQKDGKK